MTDIEKQMQELLAKQEEIKKELYQSIGKIVVENWDIGDNPDRIEEVIISLTEIANERLHSISKTDTINESKTVEDNPKNNEISIHSYETGNVL